MSVVSIAGSFSFFVFHPGIQKEHLPRTKIVVVSGGERENWAAAKCQGGWLPLYLCLVVVVIHSFDYYRSRFSRTVYSFLFKTHCRSRAGDVCCVKAAATAPSGTTVATLPPHERVVLLKQSLQAV